ncbi:MAG: multi-sensor hybrid histidine kinase, partial [Verrucomicrobiales bacterium]|nr:multi-sensor hybrid histidine kinase [Verrucomicrobiales bacterium]
DGMGGRAAISELLKINPRVPAIVCSGYSNDPVMADPAAYGFKARIPKPFTADDMLKTVAEILGKKT